MSNSIPVWWQYLLPPVVSVVAKSLVMKKKAAKMIKLLIEAGSPVNVQDQVGDTPLHDAAL